MERVNAIQDGAQKRIKSDRKGFYEVNRDSQRVTVRWRYLTI